MTTDIMGRGTDIHVVDTEMERGLVVLQVGSRPNSRVERQFAGRAGRQGQPGTYHRLLCVPELKELGVTDSNIDLLLQLYRENKNIIEDYNGDLLLNGRNSDYHEIVEIIDDALIGSESAYSTQRVDDFNTYYFADIIQTQLLTDLDKYRKILKTSMETGEAKPLKKVVAELSLPQHLRKKKKFIKAQYNKIDSMDLPMLQEALYGYIQHIADVFIPKLREYSDNATNTVKMSQQVKYEMKPENLMLKLIQQFLANNESDFILKLK